MTTGSLERLAAVIPAYNPDAALARLVDDLAARGFGRIVVVDDGSAPSHAPVFAELQGRPGVVLLRHAVNLGKGRALKTAFNWCLCHGAECEGVVTADADGQHAPDDIARVAAELLATRAFVLGVRDFPATVPLRSRLGNIVTRRVMAFLHGRAVSDTQTGLRGIPLSLLPRLLAIPGERYEYEIGMLVDRISHKAEIVQVPIATIYIDGNRSSHFNPLLDSMRIYFVLLRFFSTALVTAGIDFVAFALAIGLLGDPLPALALGRGCAILFNFLANKRFVFKDGEPAAPALLRYSLLVAGLFFLSYLLMREIMAHTPLGPIGAKLLAESLLFFLSFSVQRVFVFSGRRAE